MSKICVALIEHHELTRFGIRKSLQQQPEVEVVGTAANATEGLQMLLATKPDVAIVDINLPEQDGIELTRQLKSIQVTGSEPKIKVLILTLRDRKETVVAALAAGADSYCIKDISLNDFWKCCVPLQGVMLGSTRRLQAYCGGSRDTSKIKTPH